MVRTDPLHSEQLLIYLLIDAWLKNRFDFYQPSTQPTYSWSKLAIETLAQGVNMFKINNKDTRTAQLLFHALF